MTRILEVNRYWLVGNGSKNTRVRVSPILLAILCGRKMAAIALGTSLYPRKEYGGGRRNSASDACPLH